jgi:hypothetical protein
VCVCVIESLKIMNININVNLLLLNTYWASMTCYGLSPAFKGSSKGSFSFWTISHHLSRNSLHICFSSYTCIGLCVLALN